MPFDVKCDGCGRQFRAPDKLAGKRVKCPQCQAVILVGAAPAEKPSSGPKAPSQSTPSQKEAPAPGAKPVQEVRAEEIKPAQQVKPLPTKEVAAWHVQTGEGEEYGPVTKTELDGWVAEGRLDSNCQVLQEGWDQWKWADDVYPELAPPAAGTQPQAPFAGIGGGTPAAELNPFVSPAQVPVATPAGPAAEPSAVTPRLRRALADTKPWVMFLAIVGFIVGGLAALGGLAFFALVAVAGGAGGLLIGLAVLLTPAFYLVASYFLLTYGLRLGSFLRTGAQRELEGALVAQKSFWKLVGIVTAAALVLDAMIIAAVMALGGLAAMPMKPPGG